MFIGYNLKSEDWVEYAYKNIGNTIYSNTRKEIRTSIEKYVDKDGNINATMMQDEWFPKLDKRVFLSHSSKDKELALTIAGYLEQELGVSVFIDSCVWGFCDELLKKIDNRYCYNERTKNYSYESRNYSTSHVHNMLSTALLSMLDQCECIFFLNTDNSITKDDVFKKTSSPWIYNEIKMIEYIRKIEPSRLQKSILPENFMEHRADTAQKSIFPKFLYNVNIDNLIEIDKDFLLKWKEIKTSSSDHSLDVLYKMTGVLKRNEH